MLRETEGQTTLKAASQEIDNNRHRIGATRDGILDQQPAQGGQMAGRSDPHRQGVFRAFYQIGKQLRPQGSVTIPAAEVCQAGQEGRIFQGIAVCV